MTERSFQKELQDIVETKSPRARTFGAKFCKNAGNKKLFEMNITRERKEIISSFERKSSPESLAQNIPEWPGPSFTHNLSFTHDGYIRHTATEMIILMTDISVIWHSTGKSSVEPLALRPSGAITREDFYSHSEFHGENSIIKQAVKGCSAIAFLSFERWGTRCRCGERVRM